MIELADILSYDITWKKPKGRQIVLAASNASNLHGCCVKKDKGMVTISNTYGYIRVSTKEQNEGRQLIALREAAVPEENLFVDKQSGKDFERPGYKALLKQIRECDTLIIKSIDRLGRDFNEIIEQWRHITLEKKCGIVVLDMKLLNTGLDRSLLDRLVAEIMLIALSYVAETEREMMRQRVVEGIAAAKARGVAVGRKPIQLPQNFDFIWDLWAQGELSGREAARQLGVDNHTFAKWAKELG